MLTRILAALDGSSTSESILAYVELILASKDANVTLAMVTPEGTPREEKSARAYLADVAHKLRTKGAVVDTAILAGEPSEALLEHAQRSGTSLLMMCTRGKSGLKRLMLGSTTEEILEHATFPVFIAHPRDKKAAPPLINRIVIPLDGSHRSGTILPALQPFAKALDARVQFVTVVSPTAKESLPVEVVAKNLFKEQKEMEESGVRTDMTVRYGDPAEEVIRLADQEEHTLVALSTHGRTGLDKVLYGSVAEKILRKGTFPMLVVRTAIVPKTHSETVAIHRAGARALKSKMAATRK